MQSASLQEFCVAARYLEKNFQEVRVAVYPKHTGGGL